MYRQMKLWCIYVMELYSATKESKTAFGKMDESKKYSIKQDDSKSEGGKSACSPSYTYAYVHREIKNVSPQAAETAQQQRQQRQV